MISFPFPYLFLSLVTPDRIALLVVLLVAVGGLWYYRGRYRWRSVAEDRFLYGVPWGTLVTASLVVGFYLVVQSGYPHWEDPVTIPFRAWSYFYPTGLLTSGVAHAGPGHLLGNVSGTLVFGGIAEYAWSHYPGEDSGSASQGLLGRPAVRAVVVFPAALFAAAFLTSVFGFGPGLGFSGAVFAIAGFAVVNYPVGTAVGVVALSAFRQVVQAFVEPVVSGGFESAPPSPPAWAGIAYWAHVLGFLLGVLVALSVLTRHRRRPIAERTFFGVVLFGLAQALWLVFLPEGGDVFTLYRAAGVAFVVVLAAVIAVAVGGSMRPLPRPLSVLPWAPTRRQLAFVWFVLVAVGFGLGVAGTVIGGAGDADVPVPLTVGVIAVVAVLLLVPALPPLLPDRIVASPISLRGVAVGCLAVLAFLIAVPSLLFGPVLVDDPIATDSNAVQIRDYSVTYVENATSNRTALYMDDPLSSDVSGVVVVSHARELSTDAIRPESLAYHGNRTVQVGGPGWRESVAVNRTGWDVVGNGTVYAVDLRVDGETTRSFLSGSRRANVRIDRHRFAVVPTAEGFVLRVRDRNGTVGETPVPDAGDAGTVAGFRVRAEKGDGSVRLLVESDGDGNGDGEETATTVQVAIRETYAGS